MYKLLEIIEKNNGIKLTEKQKAVVNHTTGPALVLSCAGSGKTTVNIIKCANLILEHGVNPSNILSVTFSKAAAIEMEARFSKLFGNIIDKPVKFSTIHGLAYRIVNEYAIKNRIKLAVIEGDNSPVNKQALIKDLNLKYNKERLNDDKLDEVLSAISYCKNMLLSYEEVKVLNKSIQNFSTIYNEYENYKRKNNLVDFDDMLTLCNEYLKTDSSLLDKYRMQFKYIIVDEAQDTSKVQYEIIEKLAYPRNNLTLIGDDDQAIYGFRGAFPDYLINFPKKFPMGKIFYLDENFRSTESIVNHAGKLIKNNIKRYDKDIQTQNLTGSPVEVIRLGSGEEQLSYISKILLEKENKSDVAVLYRNNLSSLPLIDLIDRQGITFYLRDYDESFFTHWVTEDILAYLRMALSRTDINSYKRIYFKTGHYINKAAIEFTEKNIETKTVFEGLLEFYKTDGRMLPSVTLLLTLFNTLKQLRPESTIDYIRSHMGYDEYLENNAERQGYSIDNLKNILSILKLIAKGTSSIEEFFQRLHELKASMSRGKFNKHKNAVTFTTIHSAKGLEFEEVYLIDLVDNIFPSKTAIKDYEEGNKAPLEEERRVYYVGITRAKSKLTLIGTTRKNGRVVNYSRFLLESIKVISPSAQGEIAVSSYKNIFDDKSYKPIKTVKKKRESITGIGAGTRIYHRKFGEGIIIESDNSDSIIVDFKDQSYGIKKLSLSMCMDLELITPI
jgi:DNA helicase-2/ATP-dependent DNA helicase PcrA